jgi:hypothetical protein
MQVAMRTLTLSVAAAVFFCITQPIYAQGSDPIAAIQQKLQEHITLATLDANGDIATAGSVVTLQTNSLQLCSTGAPANANAPANTYKNGKLSTGMFMWKLNLGIAQIDPDTIPMHTYVTGDKLWVVHINVKKNGVEFKLWSDPDANNIRYWGWLEIPFPKNQIPSADDVMKTIAEVITVDAPTQEPAAQTEPVVAPPPPPPAPPASQYNDVAPPQAPPAPAPTITIGERKNQVVTDFGEPQRKAAVGPKEIFFYTDLKMKVTFINGKVSSIE